MGRQQVRHAPKSAALVRRCLADELRYLDLTEDSLDTVLLVASELVTNAVVHSRPTAAATLDVSWDVDDHRSVTVRVADASPVLPSPRVAALVETSGRGLAIIEATCEAWGVDRVADGKQVWARVPVEADRRAA